MKPRRPRPPSDVEENRVIRDLQVFLAQDAVMRKKVARRPMKSIGALFAPVCRFAVERVRHRTRRAQSVIAETVQLGRPK